MKFKILVPTSNEEFELPDGSNSIPDIQDYLNIYIKKAWRKDSESFNKNIHK